MRTERTEPGTECEKPGDEANVCARGVHGTQYQYMVHGTGIIGGAARRALRTCSLWNAMAVSAEPGRKKAYSSDLRWRMVYQRIAMELPLEDIARKLNVAVSTVHRTYELFETTGKVEPQPCEKPRYDLRALDPSSELYIIGLVLENPSMYLDEVCVIIRDVFALQVSASTVCRLLHSHGITRKKIRQIASQRSDEFRGAFMAQSMLYKKHVCVGG